MRAIVGLCRGIAASFALVLALVGTSVSAAPVTWEFEGVIDVLDVRGGTHWIDNGVSIGDTLRGSVTFDPDAALGFAFTVPDGTGGTFLGTSVGNPPPFLVATYSDIIISRAGTGMSDLVHAPVFASPGSRLRTNLDSTIIPFVQTGGNPYDTFAIDHFEDGFLRSYILRVIAQPPGNGVIPADRFPSLPPDLADLVVAQIFLDELDSNGTQSGLAAQFTRLEAVPEPDAIALLSASTVLLLTRRRIRRRA